MQDRDHWTAARVKGWTEEDQRQLEANQVSMDPLRFFEELTRITVAAYHAELSRQTPVWGGSFDWNSDCETMHVPADGSSIIISEPNSSATQKGDHSSE